jgi:hypothetical protein
VPALNPINAELNPICHLLALLGAHHILYVSRIGVKCFCAHHRFPLKWSGAFYEKVFDPKVKQYSQVFLFSSYKV